jgi:hypothetical protein
MASRYAISVEHGRVHVNPQRFPVCFFMTDEGPAARNLRRAGVAEGVIMKIGGWKTRSVFERYAIVSQSDIRDAMAKLEAGQQDNADAAQEQESEQVGQSLGRATSTKRDSEIPSARTTSPVN